VEYSPEELGDLIKARLGVDLGLIRELHSLARGPSGRIHRLQITGEKDYLIVGKELEIRRALSRSHLYSSAFVVDKEGGKFVLRGAGWGHGVGLCQIGAAVMANEGKPYQEILAHYYRGSEITTKA
jgi:SpoIID/LytB domain protein